MIGVERVDFIGVPVRELAEADAYFADTLALFERDPRSSDRWVEYDAPNVTLALVPEAYKPSGHEPLPFASVVVRVDDLDGERRLLTERGVEFAGTRLRLRSLRRRAVRCPRRQRDDAPPPLRAVRGRRGAAGGPSSHVDFVAVPVQDRDRAEILRRRARPRAQPALDDIAAEFETSNLTLRSSIRATAGQSSSRCPARRSRSGLRTSRRPRRSSRRRASDSPRGSSTRASATSPRSPIPTATG